MGLHKGGLLSGGGGSSGPVVANSLAPGATGVDLTLSSTLTGVTSVMSSTSTALQFISTQASGSDAFTVTTTGARLRLGPVGSAPQAYIESDVNGIFTVGGATATTGVTAGTLLATVKSQAIQFQPAVTEAQLILYGTATTATTSPTVPSIRLQSFFALTAGDLIFGVLDNSAAVMLGVTQEGNINFPGSITISSFTDDSANAGNRTVNKVRGKSAVASGQTAAVITNSFCATTSQVAVTVESTDATALYVRSVVPSGTGFTITLGPAAATANVVFSWTVIN